MRKLLPSFYDLTEEEKKTLWTHGTFVFDTNVLLSLTAFGQKQREDALNAIRNLKEAVWIPFQVAVEFTENRMVRIIDQAKRARAWHSTIDTALQGLVKAIDSNQEKAWDVGEAATEFKQHIEGLKEHFKNSLTISVERYVADVKANPNSVFDEIEDIFNGKVGPAPKSEDALADLTKDAEERYRMEIPPGFADQPKDDSTHSFRTVEGLTYKKSLGDLIVWRQILANAKNKKIRFLIFVTDDVKEDWSRSKSEARRELREEAFAHGVQLFQTTTLASFFTGLQHFRQVVVAEETVEVAREVGRDRQENSIDTRYDEAKKGVMNWLKGGAAGMAHSDTGYLRWDRNTEPPVLYDILPFAFVPTAEELADAIKDRMVKATNSLEASHVELIVSVNFEQTDLKRSRHLTSAFKSMAIADEFPWESSPVRTVRLGIYLKDKFKTLDIASEAKRTGGSMFYRTEFESSDF